LALEQLDSFWSYAVRLTGRADQHRTCSRTPWRGDSSGSVSSTVTELQGLDVHDHQTHTRDDLRKGNGRRLEESLEWQLIEGPSEISESPLYAIPLDPEAILAQRESVERLQEAISHLPAEMREVVELRDVEGLSIGRSPDREAARRHRHVASLSRSDLLRSFLVGRSRRTRAPRAAVDCNTVKAQIFPYVDGRAAPATLAEIEAHFTTCEELLAVGRPRAAVPAAYTATCGRNPPLRTFGATRGILAELNASVTGGAAVTAQTDGAHGGRRASRRAGGGRGVDERVDRSVPRRTRQPAEAAVEQHQRLTRDVLPPDIHGVSPKR